MTNAGPDGWFAAPIGPSSAVEEQRRVAGRLAAPSESATRAGLPRRSPRAHLVPGAFETGDTGGAPHRSPDEVREHLDGYQAGVERARGPER